MTADNPKFSDLEVESSNLVAGIALKAASDCAPNLLLNSSPFFSASLSEAGGLNKVMEMLSPIAAENRFLGKGEIIWANTAVAPADSPAMVILSGSPPNAAIFL